MGADQNLIRAASRMGEKPWDYSGIMKAIQAIGAYTAQKRAIANELTSYGANITNIKAVPNEVFNGDYGDQNMDFMTGAKQEWNNATNIIKNPMVLPSSKKYKQAVKTINNIKSVLENNKAGLIKWEEIRKGIQNKRAKMSKGNSPLDLKDACYKKVKAQYKVFPSAYASGAIAKCRKNKGKK